MNSVKNNNKKTYVPPSRQGTKVISGHFQEEVQVALRELLQRRRAQLGYKITVHDALAEALRDLFKKHGIKPPKSLTPGG